MSTVQSAPQFVRPAIVDDDDSEARALRIDLSDGGFDPVIVAPFGTLDELFAKLTDLNVDSILFDHELSFYAHVSYTGAKAVAKSHREHRWPSVLITRFKMDTDVSIRRWREFIPATLHRKEADPAAVTEALAQTWRELHYGPDVSRVLHRVPVFIERIAEETGAISEDATSKVADILIPAWSSKEIVRFPLDMVNTDLTVEAGGWYLSDVNLGAPDADQLYLKSLEPAPEPDDADDFS
jgi:hypothetical protein